MSQDALMVQTFLEELHRQTMGNLDLQASMYEVGAALGLAKAEAGSLAEELMVSGLIELRTLSGGISITNEGLASLGITAPPPASAEGELRFSGGQVADKADRELLSQLITSMQSSLIGAKIDYAQLEEIVIDLKTIEVQLLSPTPKIAVFRELLRSLHSAFQRLEQKSVVSKLENLIQ